IGMTVRVQHYLFFGATCLTIFWLIYQGYSPAYRVHLQTDVVVFSQRALPFLAENRWAADDVNEYQPGALWWFVFMGYMSASAGEFNSYLTTTVLFNAALLALHVWLMWRWSGGTGAFIMILLALAAGPLLLYRFELIVSLLTLLAWRLLMTKRLRLAAGLLGLATAIKIYPVILLPFVLLSEWRQRGAKRAAAALLVFAGAVATPVIAVLATGETLHDLYTALQFHHHKPIGLGGMWGNIVVLLYDFLDTPLQITAGYGVTGLTSTIWPLTNNLLNYTLLFPLLIFLGWVVYSTRRRPSSFIGEPLMFLTILLLFIFLGKVLNPQYLWWPFVFIPLAYQRISSREIAGTITVLAIGSLLVTRLIYPLHYDEFLQVFLERSRDHWLWYAILLRNGMLLAMTVLSLWCLVPEGNRKTVSSVYNR
ncbi:MAG: glycosyltransferase 87 family protein, partial [Acidobacteriota bacterium]